MDLRLYGRVISRFRWLVVGGLLLAFVLGFLTMFRLPFTGGKFLTYRQHQTYQATQTLLLTAKNCPPAAVGCTGADLALNAVLYARIANSGLIRSRVLRDGPLGGTYAATELSGGSAIGILPLVEIDAFAHEPKQASRLAGRVSSALVGYLTTKGANGVPSKSRVRVQTITTPNRPVVSSGRRYTVPIVLFLSILIVTLGLAFLLENLRPRPASSSRDTDERRDETRGQPQVRDIDGLDLGEPRELEAESPPAAPARAAAQAKRSSR